MKKELLYGGVLLLSGALYAEQAVNPDTLKKEATSVEYSLIIARDESCDEAAWNRIVDMATQATKRGETDSAEAVEEALKYMEESCTLAKKAPGIYVTLLVDDGESIKGCEGVCGGDDHKDR